MKTKLFWLLASLLFLISCRDNLTADLQPTESRENTYAKTELQTLPSIKLNNSGGVKSTSPIGNYPIDLSNPPRSVKINGTYHSDFKYWFDTNVASKIPYNIKNDISDKDGWEVIYNTIREYNPSTYQGTTDFPFIGLYNRYRGIFRFFYYHALNTEGNDVVGILALASGNNSKILNHPSIGESYPVNQTKRYLSTMGTALSSNFSNVENGLAPNHWYCFDFDVSCYDPNVNSGGLTFAITSIQRDNLEFSGNISGDITGSIIGSSSSSGSLLSIGNLFSKKDEATSTTNVNLEVNGANADAMGTSLQNKANNSTAGIDVKNLFKGIVKDGVSALKKGVSSFMSSGISGLFSSLSSSLFGSSTPTIQQVKLQTKLDLTGSGTITSKTSYSFNLEMPNKRIGLLHLAVPPTINCSEYVTLNTGSFNPNPNDATSYMLTHKFGTTNCDVVVNPDVANEIDVYTTTRILYINKSADFNLVPSTSDKSVAFIWGKLTFPYHYTDIVGLDKDTEIWWINNSVALPSRNVSTIGHLIYKSGNKDFITSEPLNQIYLKINFKIVPKNGTETFYLQKTYKANIKEYNTSNPYPWNWANIWPNGTGDTDGPPS
ncbi:hypothetical protein BZG01_11025 [Labilibaculum manganireducens]|uniref:Uncharacterized protein n=1 Tax=Labilibaculum manganireducens TaxID=1940525 RepID=A0A2N3I7R1_9BACT|nr:hypothetical protein [Labilibaculum manganireducens]PKQ66338.1 hypothetical protein BZG01_11025 [Labilibaculum manganireducens]